MSQIFNLGPNFYFMIKIGNYFFRTPIPKTNTNSTKPGDWRPISQISLPGKLLERIIHTQLYVYLNRHNILSDNQYGFRKGLSTSLAIFDVLKELYGNWNEKLFSGCVFVDFSRAFDTIDHQILINKLILYGLDSISVKFFREYMTNRTQKTTVNGHTSDSAGVTYGTAQGSILGPLIFILYVNDIFNSIDTDGSLYMYADDTLIVCTSNDINEVSTKCQKSLEHMSNWCRANKLSINYTKTKYLTVKHTKSTVDPQIYTENNKIGNVKTYEYLGMVLDDKLSMNEHVDSMIKKANAKIGILSRIRRFISDKIAIRIYKTMIKPHMDYIDFVVESSSSDRINKLDKLQNKAIRRIEYCVDPIKRLDIEELHVKYKIEKLALRRKRNLMKIIHKHSKCLENIDNVRPKMELRSKNKVKIKNKFTGISRVFNSPLYRGLRIWETLPSDVQKEENKQKFKTEVNKMIL